MKYKILVVGCPRSGTQFAARYFKNCFGLRIGHERITRDGVSSWMMAVKPKSIGYPWGNCDEAASFKTTLHQVRHPINVISSLQAIHNRSWIFIQDHLDLEGLSELERRMKFWLEWNDICESMSDLTYRVEDIKRVSPQISKIVGVPYVESSVDTSTNTRKHGMVTWKDLRNANCSLCHEVIERAAKYGYEKA